MKNEKRRIISSLLLLLTAFIWGVAFVAQTVGMQHVGPWTFVCFRYILSTLVLLPVTALSLRQAKKGTPPANMEPAQTTKKRLSPTLLGGLCCGFFLGTASIAQQLGMQQTSPGKAGFITALYVVIVPLIGLLIGRRPTGKIWISVCFGLCGLYLISVKNGFTIEKGDALVMLCAVLFSLQILSADHFSRKVTSSIALANAEFFVSAIIALCGMLLFDTPSLPALCDAAIPILYAGIFSGGIAYTLQIVAQKHTDPTIASLLMSLESVFALLAGFVILHQMLQVRELIGCGLVLAAVILAELPVFKPDIASA